jgi:hypothetical protein
LQLGRQSVALLLDPSPGTLICLQEVQASPFVRLSCSVRSTAFSVSSYNEHFLFECSSEGIFAKIIFPMKEQQRRHKSHMENLKKNQNILAVLVLWFEKYALCYRIGKAILSEESS